MQALLASVPKEAYDEWVLSKTPVKGEFRALLSGIALGAIFHESRFGLAWERERLMVPLQRRGNKLFQNIMWTLGQFCSGEVILIYFAALYWVMDKFKCVYGIWLVPLSEVLNGCLKWYFSVPRPGWVDRAVHMRAWSHEFSFPSSHAQIIWALAAFFSGTSTSTLRTRLFGSLGSSLAAYWYLLVGPYIFASSVSLSRVYEGVHYPRDVTVGAGVGVTLASVYMRLFPTVKDYIKTLPPTRAAILLQLAPLSLYGLLQVAFERYKGRATEKDLNKWSEIASHRMDKLVPVQPHTVPYASYLGMLGVMSGLALASPFLRKFPLALPSSTAKAVARLLLGNLGLFAVFFAIRFAEKQQDNPTITGILRYCRYGSMPPYILLGAPFLFKRLGI